MGSRRGPVRHPAEVARHLLAVSQADREPPRDTRARGPFDEVGGKLWSAVSSSTDHSPTTTLRMNAPGRDPTYEAVGATVEQLAPSPPTAPRLLAGCGIRSEERESSAIVLLAFQAGHAGSIRIRQPDRRRDVRPGRATAPPSTGGVNGPRVAPPRLPRSIPTSGMEPGVCSSHNVPICFSGWHLRVCSGAGLRWGPAGFPLIAGRPAEGVVVLPVLR
jgi:hypothetical protein